MKVEATRGEDNSRRAMRYILLIGLLMLVFWTVPAQAQTQTPCKIEVIVAGPSLNITGFLDLGQENNFVDNLRLNTPCEGGVEKFYFRPSDLKREGGTTEIGRQNITLVGEPKLEAKVPTDFQVKVSGVTVPGTYSGTIHLLLPDQTQAEAQTVDVQMVAKVQPALTRVPSTGLVQLRLVNCSGVLDCLIASLVFNKSAFLEETAVRFNNPAQAPVKVTAARAVVVEEQSQYQLTDKQLGLPEGEHTFPPSRSAAYHLLLSVQAFPLVTIRAPFT
jgi:hypothetical protein